MIRAALLLVALSAASQAPAGQAVPPPRVILALQPALAADASSSHAAPRAWRDTPPVAQGWSPDRYVGVMHDWTSGCEAPAQAGAVADDERGDFADADLDSGGGDAFPLWGTM